MDAATARTRVVVVGSASGASGVFGAAGSGRRVPASSFDVPRTIADAEASVSLLERYVADLEARRVAGTPGDRTAVGNALGAYRRALAEQRFHLEALLAATAPVAPHRVPSPVPIPAYREPMTYDDAAAQSRAYLALRRELDARLAACRSDAAERAALVRAVSEVEHLQRQAVEDVKALGVAQRRGVRREDAGRVRVAAWGLLDALPADLRAHPAARALAEAVGTPEGEGANSVAGAARMQGAGRR